MVSFRTISTIAVSLALTTAVALATPNAAHKMHNAMSSKLLNINLGAQGGTTQNGTATVKDTPGGLWVKVSVMNAPKGAVEPAHIHRGVCPKPNPVPFRALKPLVNGTSVTTLKGVSVADIKKGHFVINVHDAKNLKHYVSCGDL